MGLDLPAPDWVIIGTRIMARNTPTMIKGAFDFGFSVLGSELMMGFLWVNAVKG